MQVSGPVASVVVHPYPPESVSVVKEFVKHASVMWSRRVERLKQLGETPLLLFQPLVTLCQ
jgi:hypothetical protein